MKLCPKCELNWIGDGETACKCCEDVVNVRGGARDSNKVDVEQNLLPILRTLRQDVIDDLTKKEPSYELLRLRLPLLVKCNCRGKEHCVSEIRVGNSDVYRYYIKPYDINGRQYHICSQWWDELGSKDILKLFEQIKNRK